MAPVDILGGAQLPPPAVLEAILKQHEKGAEVKPVESSPDKIENPVFTIQKQTV